MTDYARDKLQLCSGLATSQSLPKSLISQSALWFFLGTFVLNSIIPAMFTKTLLTYTEAKQFHKNKACTLADIFHTKKLKISTQETNKSWFKALPFFGLL